MRARVLDPSGLVDLREAWEELASRCDPGHAFSHPEWLRFLAARHHQPGEIRLVVLESDGKLQAIAPLTLKSRKRHLVSFRTARFLASWPMHFSAPLAARPEFLAPLFQAVFEHLRFDVLLLEPLDEGTAHALCEALADQRPLRRLSPSHAHAMELDLTQDPAQLHARLAGHLRAGLSRKRRRLEAEGELRTVRWSGHDERGADHLNALLQAMHTVYQASWQGAENPAVRSWVGQPSLGVAMGEAAEQLARIGELDLTVQYLGDRPIAYVFCQARGTRMELHMTGFDQAYRDFSPGLLLLWECCLAARAAGRARLDLKGFLGEDEPYKLHLGAVPGPGLALECCSGTWKGRLLQAAARLPTRRPPPQVPWRARTLKGRLAPPLPTTPAAQRIEEGVA